MSQLLLIFSRYEVLRWRETICRRQPNPIFASIRVSTTKRAQLEELRLGIGFEEEAQIVDIRRGDVAEIVGFGVAKLDVCDWPASRDGEATQIRDKGGIVGA